MTNWRLLYVIWKIILKTRVIDGIFAWKRGCSGNNERKQMALSAKILSRDKIEIWIEEMQEYTKRTYASMDVTSIYFLIIIIIALFFTS